MNMYSYPISQLALDRIDGSNHRKSFFNLLCHLGYNNYEEGILELDRCVYWGRCSADLQRRFSQYLHIPEAKIRYLQNQTNFERLCDAEEWLVKYFQPHVVILTEWYHQSALNENTFDSARSRFIPLSLTALKQSEEEHLRQLNHLIPVLIAAFCEYAADFQSWGSISGYVYQPTMRKGYWLDKTGGLIETTDYPGCWPQPLNEWSYAKA